jgi:hypothetical protein
LELWRIRNGSDPNHRRHHHSISVSAPKATLRGAPEAAVEKLHAEINKALADKDEIDKFDKAGGLDPLVVTRAQATQIVRADCAKYARW